MGNGRVLDKKLFLTVFVKNYYIFFYLNPLQKFSFLNMKGNLYLNIKLDLFWKIYGWAGLQK